MKCRCDECPRMKEYIPVGPCPMCGNPELFMSTDTRLALCNSCGEEWALPMIISGACDDDVRRTRYRVTIRGELTKEDILGTAKIVGMPSAHLYRDYRNGGLVFENLDYKQIHNIKKLLVNSDNYLHTVPEFIHYEKFDECWK